MVKSIDQEHTRRDLLILQLLELGPHCGDERGEHPPEAGEDLQRGGLGLEQQLEDGGQGAVHHVSEHGTARVGDQGLIRKTRCAFETSSFGFLSPVHAVPTLGPLARRHPPRGQGGSWRTDQGVERFPSLQRTYKGKESRVLKNQEYLFCPYFGNAIYLSNSPHLCKHPSARLCPVLDLTSVALLSLSKEAWATSATKRESDTTCAIRPRASPAAQRSIGLGDVRAPGKESTTDLAC